MTAHENPKTINTIKALFIIILFVSFALQYLSVPVWDTDFWWHIATGKYIAETGSLPDQDPFSFTTELEENKNPFPEWEHFVLKQYWLSQLVLFFLFDSFGPAGIIILRSTLLIMTLLVVFWVLKKWSVSFPISFIFIFILFIASLQNLGERPVLFTIFFTALTFFLLEDFSENKGKRIVLLFPLMFLWSNIHGGYVIGGIVIIVFIIGEGINIYLKKTAYSKKDIYLLYGASAASLGASFMNPTAWQAILIAVNIPFKYKAIHENIQEYFSPFYLYANKIYPVNYEYLFLLLIFPIIVVLRNKRIKLPHLMILTVFCFMSASARRLVIYYAVLASMILAKETHLLIKEFSHKHISESRYKQILTILIAASCISTLIYFSGSAQKFWKNKTIIAYASAAPVKAVDFIENNHLEGNMFNDYGYGGYLAWRLYPRQKTFIDTRGLDINIRTEYGWIMQAEEVEVRGNDGSVMQRQLWKMLLNHYRINYIFLTVVNPFYQIHPVIFHLAESDLWTLVYSDNQSVIFVRNEDRNKKIIAEYSLSVEELFNTIIYQSAKNILRNKTNPRSLISLGDTFHKMNRLEDAMKAYTYALERIPDSPLIMEKLNQIKTEIKQEKEQ